MKKMVLRRNTGLGIHWTGFFEEFFINSLFISTLIDLQTFKNSSLPFRSKLAAAILGGVENIWMKPGSKVLYLGAASGTTVSHVSDIGFGGLTKLYCAILFVKYRDPEFFQNLSSHRWPRRHGLRRRIFTTIRS